MAKKTKAKSLGKPVKEVSDTDLETADLKRLCVNFKKKVLEVLGREFPDDPNEQLWGAVGAVFKSWEGRRAVSYRKIEGIPGEWGTACNVQSMVFGNLGDTSATGVAFSRNPATGENKFYGEWLVNAQGEDVVAGIRTPNPLNEGTKNPQNQHLPVAPNRVARVVQATRRHPQQAGKALPRHAGHRVHDPGRQALHAPVPQRQADRHGGLEHGDGHAGRGADRRGDGRHARAAGADRRVVAPDHRSRRRRRTTETLLSGLPAGPGGACGKIVFTSADAVDGPRRARP